MTKSIFTLLLISSLNVGFSQQLGAKKDITVKLISFECGDFCYIDLKDVNTGYSFTFQNMDDKTVDNGILSEVEDAYYSSGSNKVKMIGQTFNAKIEYRLTDYFSTPTSIEDAPKKTGKKLKKWMINELTKNGSSASGKVKPANQNGKSYLNSNGKLMFISECYIIVEGSFKNETDAKSRVAELRAQGSNDAGYLWIPDYPSLSGKPFFATFFGPYHDLNSCKNELKYYPKNDRFYYAKKVSMQAIKQAEIRY